MQPLFVYFKTVFNPGLPVLLFALRTVTAALLTLYLAFIFDLDQPKWAVMAVIIVSHPLGGMALHRSFSQVVGTTIGGSVGVLMMVLFPQAPLSFIVAMALWLGFCAAGGTLLRYTYSQAFILCGSTALVVSFLSVSDPDNSLAIAITRLTETLLAVACVCGVSLLTARPEAVARGYFAKVDDLIKLISAHAAAAIRTEESEADFNQRQMKLLGEINVLEGLRRHLYFDAPRLRHADHLVQLLGNQLVLLSARLISLRGQRELVTERWNAELPEDIQLLRNEELAILDELTITGRLLPVDSRKRFSALARRFDRQAQQAERGLDTFPDALRAMAWALRWEQSQLLQQLESILELSDALQEGRPASCAYRKTRSNPYYLDWALAGTNAARAFSALLVSGLIWIQTGWEGAMSGIILVGILCSLMATYPRPLIATQNYTRGFVGAVIVSAVYQFALLPAINATEMLLVILIPLLYVVAVGLSSPITTGIGMGFGLSSVLMIGPENVGTGHNSAMLWFEFVGAYAGACVLSLLVYMWIFPFNPAERIRYLFNESRTQVYALLKGSMIDQQSLAFESRMTDRLIMMVGVLPVTSDSCSKAMFNASLAYVALGGAFSQLKQQIRDNPLLTPDFKSRLQAGLRQSGRYIAGRPATDRTLVREGLQRLGEELERLHGGNLLASHEVSWSVLRIRASLLMVDAFIERHNKVHESIEEGVPVLAD